MKNKILIVSICLLILSLGTVGVTLAFFVDEEGINNEVTVGSTDVIIKEKLTEKGKEDVKVCLPSNTSDSWIRVFVSLPTTLTGQAIYQAEAVAGFNEDWTYNELDGYFYSASKLSAGEDPLEIPLYARISMNAGLAIEDLPNNYDIILYAEAVQDHGEANGIDAFNKLK